MITSIRLERCIKVYPTNRNSFLGPTAVKVGCEDWCDVVRHGLQYKGSYRSTAYPRIYSRPWLFEDQITLSTAMINLYPVDDATRFAITYPLYSDLSVGYIALSGLYTTGPSSFMVT